jgi:hypothetical protein
MRNEVNAVPDRWWDTDQQLLAALRDALDANAEVPETFRAAGRAVFRAPDLDAELAALSYDSATQPLALVRGGLDGGVDDSTDEPATVRALSFAHAQLSIHLQVADGAVLGQLVPPQCAELVLQTPAGKPTEISTDEDGWFALRPFPAGRFRLRCRTADHTVVTGWITL